MFEGEDKYLCEKCGQKVCAIKHDNFARLPTMPIVHIQRAEYNKETETTTKNNQAVRYNHVPGGPPLW